MCVAAHLATYVGRRGAGATPPPVTGAAYPSTPELRRSGDTGMTWGCGCRVTRCRRRRPASVVMRGENDRYTPFDRSPIPLRRNAGILALSDLLDPYPIEYTPSSAPQVCFQRRSGTGRKIRYRLQWVHLGRGTLIGLDRLVYYRLVITRHRLVMTLIMQVSDDADRTD
jgi:hypothetical protein